MFLKLPSLDSFSFHADASIPCLVPLVLAWSSGVSASRQVCTTQPGPCHADEQEQAQQVRSVGLHRAPKLLYLVGNVRHAQSFLYRLPGNVFQMLHSNAFKSLLNLSDVKAWL